MPSFAHEAILELFRRRPTLATELLERPSPSTGHVRVGDSNVGDLRPTERAADLVLLFSDALGGPPRRAVVLEVQLAIDAEKRRAWWSYLARVHTQHRCDASLVVVTLSPKVAGWAAKPTPLNRVQLGTRGKSGEHLTEERAEPEWTQSMKAYGALSSWL